MPGLLTFSSDCCLGPSRGLIKYADGSRMAGRSGDEVFLLIGVHTNMFQAEFLVILACAK
jgi:hypothetical protein